MDLEQIKKLVDEYEEYESNYQAVYEEARDTYIHWGGKVAEQLEDLLKEAEASFDNSDAEPSEEEVQAMEEMESAVRRHNYISDEEVYFLP